MNTVILGPWKEILGGLFAGILFGFLLRKAKVTSFSTIIGQLLLKDFTVMKVIMTAIVTGGIGIYAFHEENFFILNTTTLWGALLGGGIFGIGMAVLGFCPGTCVGALAESSKKVWVGILGMILGAATYAELYPWITLHLKPASEFNKETLSQYFHISPWLIISLLLVALISFAAFERTQQQKKKVSSTT